MTDPTHSNDFPNIEFLAKLSERFEFNVEQDGLIKALKLLFRRYSMEQSVFGDQTSKQQVRARYQKLKQETERFRALLSSTDYEDLETDLYWASLHKNELESDPDISVIGNPEDQSGNAYLSELDRLLSLVEKAADLGVGRFAPAKGRKRKLALENAVRRAAYIWEDLLERRFTLDYHQGSALTPAFEFVREIVAKLDSEITETELITAMRSIIKERRGAGFR